MSLYLNNCYKKDLIDTVANNKNILELANSTVFITGATGLIGSYLVELCLCANEQYNTNIKVIASARNIQRLQERFKENLDSNLEFVEYDVNKDISFDIKADYYIHAASNAYPAAFSAYPVETIVSNVVGTHNLLNYCKEKKAKRFLYVSSGEIYGQLPPETTEFVEEMSGYVDPILVRSCYPSAKRTAETLCAAYASQYDVDTVVVRPCHSYGPNVTNTDNRATVQFMNNVLKDEDIILKSEGKQRRSYMYVADCASAIITVLVKGNKGEAYNVANENSIVTIAEFANITAEVAGKKVVFDIPNDGSGNTTPISHQVLSTKKLNALGFKPLFDAKRGIEHTYKILKSVR